MKPTVGRIVKYRDPSSSDVEYAAIVTATHDEPVGQKISGEMHVFLTVFTPNGSYEARDVPFEGAGMSSWRWPERVG